MINLTTFFNDWGIVAGNGDATDFYSFWNGLELSGGTIISNITEFMNYHNTTRYEFFHNLQSTYSDVFDEYTFYSNIDDPEIYDFTSFYQHAASYLTPLPSPTPTPTPTNTPTPTPTPTNTPTPTPTITPTPSPLVSSVSYISEARQTNSAGTYNFTSQNYGGSGYIVVGIGSTSSTDTFDVNSVTIAGVSATKLATTQELNQINTLWGARINSGTSGTISVSYNATQLNCGIVVYRVQNITTDGYNQRIQNIESQTDGNLQSTFVSNVNTGDIVIALATNDDSTSVETWTRPTEDVAVSNDSAIRISAASQRQTTSGSYTVRCQFSKPPNNTSLLTAITLR